jgi:hypothetical protein
MRTGQSGQVAETSQITTQNSGHLGLSILDGNHDLKRSNPDAGLLMRAKHGRNLKGEMKMMMYLRMVELMFWTDKVTGWNDRSWSLYMNAYENFTKTFNFDRRKMLVLIDRVMHQL